ncbi:hypothetical protein DWZ55_18105 [Bacteroides sp. AF33-23]|uniref:Uncharacterized protein n=8 Tax=Bacteroidales TaxID=171549 RepID=A0A414KYB8_BACSE|nr:hypothetical protein D8S85_03780 [Butyricimonas faecalis]KAA2365673.1 hypothetical protein F2Y13_14540 [Alistipes shahii]KAA5447400.1 hypothetical protein F2Y48_18190 [Bacteroides caccae]KAB3873156.1 hypothetical protein GAS34_18490 [Bacteroides uniformis]KAB5260044.1 hypothetical protein F9966_14700 [Bacteroides stercoris]KAB6158733.1 hypothetical protein GA433_01925 [Bacteroides xylanisolvens]RGN82728.1 hypothetical protein DXB40_12020 [Bacteroides sp. 4_1_36]RGV31147.1 hypothetical pro
MEKTIFALSKKQVFGQKTAQITDYQLFFQCPKICFFVRKSSFTFLSLIPEFRHLPDITN